MTQGTVGDRPPKIRGWTPIALGIILLFVGLGGISGGIILVLDPSGAGIGFGLEILEETPFSDFLIPGLVLLVLNGMLACGLGVLALLRHPLSGFLGCGFGGWLTGFMIAEIGWVGMGALIQPLFLGIGILLLALGAIAWRASRQPSA